MLPRASAWGRRPCLSSPGAHRQPAAPCDGYRPAGRLDFAHGAPPAAEQAQKKEGPSAHVSERQPNPPYRRLKGALPVPHALYS